MKTLAGRDLTNSVTGSSQSVRSFADPNYFTFLYYTCEKDCDDIMTVEGIQKAWKYEKFFTQDDRYAKTCLATSSSDLSCKPTGKLSIP